MALRRILAPTDFSDASSSALGIAHQVAARSGAELRLFHVSGLSDPIMVTPEPAFMPRQLWLRLWERESQGIERRLGELRQNLEQLGSEVVVSTSYARGDAVQEILSAAREFDADLIVMAATGASQSLRYLFGGVTTKVSRQSECPVLVTRREASTDGHFQNVVVAVDYSPVSDELVKLAAELSGSDAKTLVLHVWPQPTVLQSDESITASFETIRGEEVRRMQRFVAAISETNPNAEGYVDVGSPAHQILEQAEERSADLIVVGAHSRVGVERVIGTVADRVLRNTNAAVLLVPVPEPS